MSKQPVRVVIRNRPTHAPADNIMLEKDGKTVTIRQSTSTIGGGAKQELLSFSCDAVLDNASQETVFEEVARPICDAVLDGFNGTVMCYGQTGAGKSFSMVGDGQDYQLRGIAPRAFGLIFREMSNRPEWVYTVRLSFLEIYNENLYDLLATLPEFGPRTELSLLSDGRSGVPVKGLTAAEVKSEEEALRYLFEAESNRAVAQHALNSHSSRGHVLYLAQIERRSRMHSSGAVQTARLTLVDLAGSERLKKSGATSAAAEANLPPAVRQQQQRQQLEAMAINKSLAFLEQVVMALGKRGQSHVPHRSSRLTAVLRDALGGNCRTTLVANIWGESRHVEETISTLKFALRMQNVSTSAVLNQLVELSPAAALQQCQTHVGELKRELAMHNQLAHRSAVQYDPFTDAQQAEVQQQVRAFLDDELDDLVPSSLRHAREIFAQFKALYREQAKRAAAAPPTQHGHGHGQAGHMGGQSRQANQAAQRSDDNLEMEIPPVEVITGLGEEEFVGDLTSGDQTGGAPEGFSCGEAPDAASPAVALADLLPARNRTDRSAAAERGASRAEATPHSPSPADAAAEKARAYEEYKRGQGLELSTLLTEHKAGLREKRARVRNLASEVNACKNLIDELKDLLERKTEQRAGISASLGEVGRAEGGEEVDVIDEEEFAWLTQCKQAKAKYRQTFEELREVRSDADYTASLIENTRAQLLSDFDAWLQEEMGFGASSLPREPAAPSPYLEAPDMEEEFEAIMADKIMQDDPDSFAFAMATKSLRPKGGGKAGGKGGRQSMNASHSQSGPRSKPRPFQ